MSKESRYRLTGEIPEIDIRRWRKSGNLEPRMRFIFQWFKGPEVYAGIRVHVESHWRLWLSYHYERHGVAEDLLYPITIDWTACHLGGHRPWFICPNSDCGRRCAILYADRTFQCRKCLELRYPSQREPHYDRLARRAENIRHRLSWSHGMLAGPEPKPKRMHWRTFWRLFYEHEGFAEAAVKASTPLRLMKQAAQNNCWTEDQAAEGAEELS